MSHGPRLRKYVEIGRETVSGFSRDRGTLIAAALSFYTLLSIAPLIIVAVAIAGLILGRGAARQEVLALLNETMGPTAAATVGDWATEASKSGGWATLVGIGLVVFAASKLTGQLRMALNEIWNVEPPQAESLGAAFKEYAKHRLFAVLLVIATGPLLIVIVLSRALLTGFHQLLFASTPGAGVLIQFLQFAFSLGLMTTVAALVFRIVPDVRLGWRAIWTGAALTSLLFNAGNLVLGWYLARATVTATYGAAAAAVVILLWTYFSSALFLLGAEFTQVYARYQGAPPDGPVPERELEEAAPRTG